MWPITSWVERPLLAYHWIFLLICIMSQRRKSIYLAEISTEIDCGRKCKKTGNSRNIFQYRKSQYESQNVHFWVLKLHYFQISVRKLECLTLFLNILSKEWFQRQWVLITFCFLSNAPTWNGRRQEYIILPRNALASQIQTYRMKHSKFQHSSHHDKSPGHPDNILVTYQILNLIPEFRTKNCPARDTKSARSWEPR